MSGDSTALDDLARAVASGHVSRRQALLRAGAVFATALVAGPAEALAGKRHCPPGRKRCADKCCPRGARCRKGKCKCPPGTKKCGKACVDVGSDVANCGTCGRACGPRELCVGGVCTPPPATCADGILNGTETDVDCGGNCPKCAEGKRCNTGADCATGVCAAGVCAQPAATCSDGIRNGTETDVDCGGPGCPPCSIGMGCATGSDCATGVCQAGTCVAPPATCSDGVKNGTETDVDCGGPNCPKCANGKACAGGSDCLSGSCAGGICKTASGAACAGDGECASGSCCGGLCRDLQTDVSNCGVCGRVCSTAGTTSTSCAGGICHPVCQGGGASCDPSGAFGCVYNLQADPMNCGACGHNCYDSMPQHATSMQCQSGTCKVGSCEPGWATCGSFEPACSCDLTTGYCQNGGCLLKVGSGESCTSNQQCLSGTCNGSTCA